MSDDRDNNKERGRPKRSDIGGVILVLLWVTLSGLCTAGALPRDIQSFLGPILFFSLPVGLAFALWIGLSRWITGQEEMPVERIIVMVPVLALFSLVVFLLSRIGYFH